MALALVNTSVGADASGGSSTTIASAAFVATAGNLLVVAVRGAATPAPSITVSDTAGNVFTSVASQQTGIGSTTLQLFYAKNILGNATNVVTATFGATSTFRAVEVLQYSGADPSTPLDVSATGTATGANSVTSGAFTTTAANEVIVAAATENNTGFPLAAGTGFTREVQDTNDILMMEDKIVSTIQTAVTASASSTNGNNWEIVVGTFKASTGKTVTVILEDETFTPIANLSGIHWAWYDIQDPGALAAAPINEGSTGSTNAAGSMTISVPNSALTSGQGGMLAAKDPVSGRSVLCFPVLN